MQRSTFLSSQGRSFDSRIFSLRRYAVLSSILNRSSRGSDCTMSTMSTSFLLSALSAALIREPGVAMSSGLEILRFSSSSLCFFSLSSVSSWPRSLSSFWTSSFRRRFSTASIRSTSRENSSMRQAFRFFSRVMRCFSRSRSSCCLCTTAPPLGPSSGGPKISSTFASMEALQLTAFRSSSQSSSSSVLTRRAACCDRRHCWMRDSARSSTSTLISCPQSTRLDRQVEAFHAASGSPNCAKPKLKGLPSASRPRLKAWTSPHCSMICCMWPSSSSGASLVTSR
mmetsp:Transcript_77944/g.206883  ORF Transcript_77944/g.206883 Transcript_77944/m.206883 type:complete len:283 (+) Transcript_77944:337-1185(+)